MEIRLDDLSGQPVQDLLAAHLAGMQQNSPPESVYALDLSGLRSADVSVWTAWHGDDLCGIGALKQLSPSTGEIKSMRTDPRYLRRGVGLALLDHIIAAAQARGYRRLSLETGSGAEFEAALSLYRKRGFANGEPFGDYAPTDFNQFLHLQL
ncbi:GNAT family N-acetyltransferase [Sphingorhabdus sp. SMR4y]|uniref:GNAT family N-acetyltransferase n=1 Tax=Sphingorhabdus sp. SMR4y TaxID=2584094 RepID=UPI000B60082E|nr:GNAT family N-acetyltransferase [Sphingorhabdus sp. SMR4y]ASK87454.1 putative N-acetyltransferase YsnE [Sphingorhabdus sp. SMR4y]